MIVLVTGANGLVGRHIVDKLSSKGISTIAQFHSNPITYQSNQYIFYLEADLCNSNSYSLFNETTPDIIVHCAAQIPTSLISSDDAANINNEIDTQVYKIATQHNIPVIFISSVIVYETSSEPYQENAILHPFSPYGIQKLKSESIFTSLNKPSVSFRISSPYGGDQKSSRNVLYKFIHSALKGEDLMVYGRGNRRQDFIYGSDIAEAVWLIVLAKLSNREVSGIFNIASGSTICMRELAELIVRVAGNGTVVHYAEDDLDDRFNPIINIDKAREVFGWQPNTTLASGIQSVIASLRS
jgi:UDP-glucose 4-epimerase